MEKAKAKTENKFNGAKVARQVGKSLKSAFPGDKFLVSEGKPVEVFYMDTNKSTAAEVAMFRTIFCEMAKVKKEDLLISQVRKDAAAPVQATAK